MFWLALSFAAGIVAAALSSVAPAIWFVMALASGGLAVLFNKRRASTLLVAIALFSVGALSSQIETKRNNAENRLRTLYDNGTIKSGTPVEVEGILLGRPEPSVDGEFLVLRAESLRYRRGDLRVSGKVRFFVSTNSETREPNDTNLRSQISNLKYGSRIRVACNLEREDEYLNPGVMPKREVLDRLGIDATGAVKSSLLIEHIADETVFLPLAWVYNQRNTLIDDFRRGLGQRAAGVMIASLLGNKYFLDKDTADLFRDGGTFHILVISGLHITVIGGLLLLFLRQTTKNRWIQFALTASMLWAYTLAVGADVPVVRASVMFTIVLFAYATYRSGTLINSLGICGLLLLVWRPSELFDPSFQLTFVSVGAIVAVAYPVLDTLKRIGSWTPTAATPFPPNVPERLRRFCEMVYWRERAWSIESKRQVWSARLFKSPYLDGKIRDWSQKTVRYLFEGLLVSLIVQVCMLPLSVGYFHRVSVASVLLNLWVGIFIAIESFVAVIGAVAGHIIGGFAAPLMAVADLTNWLMLSLPRLLSGLNWASFRLPAYSGTGRAIYFLFYVPVIILALAIDRWKPFDIVVRSGLFGRSLRIAALAALVLSIAIIILHPIRSPAADGRLHVDFLDVGQGDSALITFPNGQTLLVDAGGRTKYRATGNAADDETEPFEPDTRGIGEAVVSEVLWFKGYSRIHNILATHADADHIQGFVDVAKNFSIGSAFFGRTPRDNVEFTSVAEVLRQRGVPVAAVARGDVLRFGDVTVEVLYPTPAADPNSVSDNNHSVVLRIIYGSRTFLMTGDIESLAEDEIINGGDTLKADLIKVPHHGSRTSSTEPFVDAVVPKYAIISVGRRSTFGHPHKDVVERWKRAGADVMTTGERGMISVSTDGRDLQVNTFIP